ncbi:hypothetical protein HAX54_047284 [Datura stramonium]|uniref:Uncharacterized protein n=1 Tax=Datura stramonium TaxID=4076 RepID=A0ABS8SSH1_DATST|nr:hypothetical protein [Datura stramonium]
MDDLSDHIRMDIEDEKSCAIRTIKVETQYEYLPKYYKECNSDNWNVVKHKKDLQTQDKAKDLKFLFLVEVGDKFSTCDMPLLRHFAPLRRKSDVACRLSPLRQRCCAPASRVWELRCACQYGEKELLAPQPCTVALPAPPFVTLHDVLRLAWLCAILMLSSILASFLLLHT